MNWFLENLRDRDVRAVRTAKLILAMSTVNFASGVLCVVLLFYFGSTSLGTFAAVVTPLIPFAAFFLRWTGSLALATHYYMLTIWLYITGVSLLLGGVVSLGYPAYSTNILGAAFLAGRRAGIIWTGISLVTVIAVEIARNSWLQGIQVPVTNEAMLYVSIQIAVLFMTFIYALQYDSAKNSALQELGATNHRIARMIAQLEKASDQLLRSSEQFLGTASSGTRSGLVGQMMQKARNGRDTIDQSRGSISSMIEHYRRISSRVQDLYKHSQVIVDLVATIDRISDRLDMMALNLGIEAARSGESYKQFAILARDMRSLAERVLTETKQIKTALHNVYEQVRMVLETSASGQVLTEESAQKLSAMAHTFDDIFSLIEQTEGATEQITADTLTQLDAVRKLVTAAVGSDEVLTTTDGTGTTRAQVRSKAA